MSCAIESLATAARKAMWALFPRFKLAGITDISIKLRMFSCLVVPIMEYCSEVWGPDLLFSCDTLDKLWDNELQKIQNINKTNKNLRCGNRKGRLSRNDQTHHRMGPKTMESIPPSKRNTQADIQLRTRQTNKQKFKVRQPQRAAKSKTKGASESK